MKFFHLTFFSAIFLLLTISISAQTPSSTPAPGEEILKISTTLIQVDVSVTDKKGNIVRDLKPEDFEVYENGEKQDITNFSFMSSDAKPPSPETVKTTKPSKNSLPVPPVKLKADQVRRAYALVVDDLGLNFANTFWVKESLKKFVSEQMQEGDLVAIVRTGIGIGTLQSFTSDKRQLLAAISKIKWNLQGRGGISNFEPLRPVELKGLSSKDSGIPAGITAQGIEKDTTFDRQIEEFRNEIFSIGTLGALNYVVRGMRDLPGRKAVLLFSEGFALRGPIRNADSKISRSNRILDALRILADLANRSSVVFYTIDPRGLQNQYMFSSDDDATGDEDLYDTRIRPFTESQQSLDYLSYETGGLPFKNQNSIDLGIRRAIADQSSYYLLGYQPDSETFNPKQNKFNKLEVRLKRPGLKVRYRSGFFGVSDEKIQNATQTPQQQLITALISPFGSSDIDLNLYPVYQNDAKSGDLIQALVHIDAKDLRFTSANGKQKAHFDIVAMTFGDNGATISQTSRTYTIEVTDEVYQKLLTNGFVYKLDVPVKKPGAYQFRIALRDSATSKIGAASQFIEVPNSKKKIALSNLILDNFTPEEWQKVRLGNIESQRGVLLDTTLREFTGGTVLRYDYVIYNPKQTQTLTAQMRLVNNGKVVYEESPAPIKTDGQTDLTRLQSFGAINLGKNLDPGSYILQIIVADPNVKGEESFTTQFVEFEITK